MRIKLSILGLFFTSTFIIFGAGHGIVPLVVLEVFGLCAVFTGITAAFSNDSSWPWLTAAIFLGHVLLITAYFTERQKRVVIFGIFAIVLIMFSVIMMLVVLPEGVPKITFISSLPFLGCVLFFGFIIMKWLKNGESWK